MSGLRAAGILGCVMTDDTISKRAVSALLMTLGILAGLYLTASLAHATPTGSTGPVPGEEHRRMGGTEGRPEHPLLRVFDTNRDGELSASEIAAASALLRSYDSDGDGQLSVEELVRALPPPPGAGRPMGREGDHRGPPSGE